MAKEIGALIKLQVKGGAANPAPPIGPALGSKGLNIMDFCKQFNARTQDKQGQVLPVLLTIYNDKTFDFADLGTAVTLVPGIRRGSVCRGHAREDPHGPFGGGHRGHPRCLDLRAEGLSEGADQTFLDPEQDPQGAGYQQIQARITAGSGGVTGKGYLQGTQGQYKFLPVAHNDFIYSVLAEELGFVGVLGTLALYLIVILRALDAARLSRDRLGAYLVAAIVAGFSFQVIYNITMSAGLAPVKGLTLAAAGFISNGAKCKM